jgi:very-short-patch-repair endonuclease
VRRFRRYVLAAASDKPKRLHLRRMSVESHETPNEAPTVSSDFFSGDIRRGLEAMRLRLLDLALRNRLLNFRHTKKSSLRVIDELPKQLFEQLTDGKELYFKPVPRPRGLRLPSSAGGASPSVVADLFDVTSAADAGDTPPEGAQAPWPHYPTAKEHAETLGLATSFDLAEASGGAPAARHTDRDVQTLHYPEELESILRSINAAARMAIEETGTNMLYLVFGFLDWYEDAASTQVRSAPLVLLPVRLRRGDADPNSRAYRYAVCHSGEEIMANLSLQERLRRDFGVDVPGFGEDDTPDSYLAKLEPLLQRDPRWKVRRQITLTLLSFGKLLMFRDLDPKTWPENETPADHPRIKDFFEGVQRDGVSFAEEYALDDPALREQVPSIVVDADSSQHSALIDALSGRNLVIEGPPGTGKSQTITNLIAAALVKGKSVLFVAEKLAALEVVRHRLDRLSLGMFCLELHSHKAHKRQLLDDVGARLKLHQRMPQAHQLEEKLRLVEEDKRCLTEYAILVNSAYGRTGLTLHDIMWQARRRRSVLVFDPSLVEHVLVPGVRELNTGDVENIRQAVTQLSRHTESVSRAAGSVRAHAWYGVTSERLTFLDTESVAEKLSAVLRSAQSLLDQVAALNTFVGDEWLAGTPTDVGHAVETARSLPASADGVLPELVPLLSSPDLRRRLGEFGQWIERHRTLSADIARRIGAVPEIGASALAEAQQLLAVGASLAPGAETVGALEGAGRLYSEASAALRCAVQSVARIGDWLGLSLPVNHGNTVLLLRALDRLQTWPLDAMEFRHHGLEAAGSLSALAEASADAMSLKEERQRLSALVDLKLAPDVERLRQHVVATANARWWSFLSRDVRAAKRDYVAMARVNRNPTRDQLREDFRALFDYEDRCARFSADARYRAVAGEHFEGIDTAFDRLMAVARWRYETRQTVAYAGDLGLSVLQAVWGAPSERLHGLISAEAEGRTLAATLGEGVTAHAGVMQFLPPSEGDDQRDWSNYAEHLARAGAEVTQICSRVSALGLPAGLPLSDAPGVLRQLADLDSLRTLVASARDVADALSEHFRGAVTDTEAIARSLAFSDAVRNSTVPTALRDWLLAEDSQQRTTLLHESLRGASDSLAEYQSTWQAYVASTQLDSAAWFGSATATEHVSFDAARDRAERALAARATLPSWLDYVAARAVVCSRGLGAFAEHVESGQLGAEDLVPAVDFVVSNSLVQEAFSTHPQLARFSGLSHDQIRARFAQLDNECIELYRVRAANLIDQRPIPAGIGYGPVSTHTELHLLEREIDKQKRHIPVRQLVRRAGRALQALKPCFMMGPLSVAQYLAPGTLKFDLVVMDEASQLRPQDALGAIARASQVVVVGDRMQLPPTSFFDRLGDEGDEDETDDAQALTDAESILDVAASTYKPARLLRWHYRSRHGSLIAFSNREFYKNQLIAFPSPMPTHPALGVKFVHVKDGVFEGRKNVEEAKRVVDTVLRHMRTRSNESLGVVTMNSTQRELIESLLEQRLKDDPAAQEYVRSWEAGLEPFFIKNLENVQGDERSVIYISVTYGPAPGGHVFQRFGPINSPTGHRRLNVLFTRARRRVVVFSSMLADQVQSSPTSSWGVRALKSYLHFAQTGVLEQAMFSGREPDSDFEVEVADALRARGFDVVAQVGVAGYFIDLAVKHPQKVDSFILGVECDGKSYHSSVSARDRDRLRQAVLEDLGWSIHRIWSTDWFKQSSHEVQRIVERIEVILRADAASADAPSENEVSVEAPPLSSASSAELDFGEDTWVDEAAAQPLSVADSRTELLSLREEIERALPGVPPQMQLLGPQMLELLLQARPTTHEQWMRAVPLDVRLDIDGAQVKQYLSRVLEITRRMAR